VPAPPSRKTEKKETLIDFDEGSPLSRVLRMLAAEAGLSYLEPKIDPNETIAFSLRGMTPRDAFFLVARSRGFDFVEKDGVIELSRSAEKKDADELITKTYPLRHVDARLVISSVASLLGISEVRPPAHSSPAFPEPITSGNGGQGGQGNQGNQGGANNGNSGAGGLLGFSGGNNNGSGTSGSADGSTASNGLPIDGRFVPGLPMDAPLWTGGYDASKKNSIYLDRIINALVVRAPRKQQEEVERYIARIDVEEPQIEITTRVIEIDVGKMTELGLDWTAGYTSPKGKFSGGGLVRNGTYTGGALYEETRSTAQAILAGWQVAALLRAAQTADRNSLVTDARVVTRSGIPAVVNNLVEEFIEVFRTTPNNTSVGGSGVSVLTNSLQSGTQSFRTGVLLDVLPRVLEDGRIDLNINPTVLTRIGQTTGASGQKLPVIVRRSATTSVMVRDGFTVGIGGLMQLDDKRGRRQVPVMGNLPVLGPLFRTHNDTSGKKNLVVLVTPRILRDDSFMSAPALPEARDAARAANTQIMNPTPWVSPKRN
jgi:type II secretory pathway component GspD/PulD (secretin)